MACRRLQNLIKIRIFIESILFAFLFTDSLCKIKKRNKKHMKKSDFRKAYLSFARLYGAIYSDNAYQILKKYFPRLKKSAFNKDLKSRYLKLTKGYDLFYCGYQHYVITRDYFRSEDIDEVFRQQAKKPFYIPETFEEFVQCGDGENLLLTNLDYEKDLRRFFKRHLIKEEKEEGKEPVDEDKYSEIATYCLIRHMEYEFEIGEIIDFAKRLGLNLSEEKTLQKFVEIMQNIINNMRNIYNCGFTPMEMIKMSGSIDFDNMKVKIGKNMKNMFLSGKMDPFEYLQSIDESDLPYETKKSLKEEITNIIKKIKSGKA